MATSSDAVVPKLLSVQNDNPDIYPGFHSFPLFFQHTEHVFKIVMKKMGLFPDFSLKNRTFSSQEDILEICVEK